MNYGIKESGSGETEFQTKNVLSQKLLDPTSEIPKFHKLREPNTFFYRRVPPAEPCELCGGYPIEYEIKIDDGSILRRCPRCFKEMRREFVKVKWVEVREVSGF